MLAHLFLAEESTLELSIRSGSSYTCEANSFEEDNAVKEKRRP